MDFSSNEIISASWPAQSYRVARDSKSQTFSRTLNDKEVCAFLLTKTLASLIGVFLVAGCQTSEGKLTPAQISEVNALAEKVVAIVSSSRSISVCNTATRFGISMPDGSTGYASEAVEVRSASAKWNALPATVTVKTQERSTLKTRKIYGHSNTATASMSEVREQPTISVQAVIPIRLITMVRVVRSGQDVEKFQDSKVKEGVITRGSNSDLAMTWTDHEWSVRVNLEKPIKGVHSYGTQYSRVKWNSFAVASFDNEDQANATAELLRKLAAATNIQ